MPRPTSRDSLLEQATAGFQRLTGLVDGLTPEQRMAEFAVEDRDRTVRDVLFHLHAWHGLLADWIEGNRDGAAPFFPGGYTWKTYPELNLRFWEQAQDVRLEQAYQDLVSSHARVLALIAGFSDEELFTKRYFGWTGSTSLGAYCVSATSSHYDWALKKLRRHR
jgi:hypothetical protein